MRASTLATFVEVSTLPETVSPECTTGVLMDRLIICGAALSDTITGGGGGEYAACACCAWKSGMDVESGALEGCVTVADPEPCGFGGGVCEPACCAITYTCGAGDDEAAPDLEAGGVAAGGVAAGGVTEGAGDAAGRADSRARQANTPARQRITSAAVAPAIFRSRMLMDVNVPDGGRRSLPPAQRPAARPAANEAPWPLR